MNSKIACTSRILFLLTASLSGVFAQGTFPPPAGPAVPAMKTLQQVEPRVDLLNSVGSNGVTTDANDQFVISSPGSYYLSGNLSVTKYAGIEINSPDVTLDLNGFEISHSGGRTGYGVVLLSHMDRIEIRNGSLTNFDYGVSCDETVSTPVLSRSCSYHDLRFGACNSGLLSGQLSVIFNCTAHDCETGIAASASSIVRDCTCTACTSNAGIFTENSCTVTHCLVTGQVTSTSPTSVGGAFLINGGSTVSDCTASGNKGTAGFYLSGDCALTNCTASSNNSTWGFVMGPGSSAANCAAYFNTSANAASGGFWAKSNNTLTQCSSYTQLTTASTLSTTTGMGFMVSTGCAMQNCTAGNNKGDGIQGTNCTLHQCSCTGNTGNGVDVTQDCSISGCTVTGNKISGIVADSGGSILDCTANSNTISGIVVGTNGRLEIRGNMCATNGSSTNPGAGIQIKGPFTRVDGNHITQNYRGIEVVDGVVGVFVVRNAAALNLDVNFKIASGNKVGVIVSAPQSGAINGSTGGAGVGSTDPWANVSY